MQRKAVEIAQLELIATSVSGGGAAREDEEDEEEPAGLVDGLIFGLTAPAAEDEAAGLALCGVPAAEALAFGAAAGAFFGFGGGGDGSRDSST
jgi:hypothetical protein